MLKKLKYVLFKLKNKESPAKKDMKTKKLKIYLQFNFHLLI